MPNYASPVFKPRAMLHELLDHGVEFVVVGGVAVQAHGHLRATEDLDIVPAPDLLNLSRLGEALAALGGPAGDPHKRQRAPRVSVETDFGALDLLYVERLEGVRLTYEQLRDRAREVDLEGRTVLVTGLDHLIRMKRVAGRDIDLNDIGALTRTDEELRLEAERDRQEEAGEST